MKRLILLLLLIAVSLSSKVFASNLPDINGFAEGAIAPKFGSDMTKHKDLNMAETRLQLKSKYFFSGDTVLSDWQTALYAKVDLVEDMYMEGSFTADLRELNVSFTPLEIMDVKLGRQVLTWGTGDYLFLNDLFPKDYVSFFIGRDDEYLKKPNDALRVMLYPEWFNVDLVFIPFFEPNQVPEGRRVSFFDPFVGGIAGLNTPRELLRRSRTAENFTYAGRIYRNFSNYEAALYYYRGFDPSPRSYYNEMERTLYYERLDAYGASIRGPVLGGIGNLETSYYYSPEDSDGKIRTIQNSMMKYLAGYEKDLGNDLKVGFQYYIEEILDYTHYREGLHRRDYRWDQFRHVLTCRITKLFANQTINASIFTFFSPNDMDCYIRPSLSWKATDSWTLTVGANMLWGRDSWTEFAGYEKNKNVYMRLRYSF